MAVPKEFPPGSIGQISDIPPGPLRAKIESLGVTARDRAVAWLGNLHFTDLDLNSLRVDAEGGVYYADPAPVISPNSVAASEPPISSAAVPVSPFPASLVFHSRPGSPNILYLNFAGENVSGTAWNTSLERSTIPAVPFSSDSDYSTFSDAEQLAIRRIWQRMAEDFAPFDIDVTTERPAQFGRRTAHALITRNTDANGEDNPSPNAGGVAYVGVFGNNSYTSYQPAWVYANNLFGDDSYIAEAASHEIGHNLGLTHDGTTSGQEYYGGHGNDLVSWAPIMGAGYNRNVTQWSKGDYYQANNTQDDLATIASRLSYNSDDHGDTAGNASGLVIVGTNVFSTNPETDPENASLANKGVLDVRTDVDVFSFATGFGPIELAVEPWVSPSGRTRGGNLDIKVELYDDAGQLIAADSPTGNTDARIAVSLNEGVYYLHVCGMGTGSPSSSSPSGYTEYGSIGQYFISGFVVPSDLSIPPGATLLASDVTSSTEMTHSFQVEYVDNAAVLAASIGDTDIRVTGPGDYSELASLLDLNPTSDASSMVATYSVPSPSGLNWNDQDNGVYVVSLQPDEVADVEGEWAAGGALGSFSVAIPRAIFFADMDNPPGWDLEPLWEYGAPDYGNDGPSVGVNGINILGYNLTGNYENRLDSKYAITPPIDLSNVTSATLRFQRWLRIQNGDVATIEISADDSTWIDVWTSPRTVTDNVWREVQYAIPESVMGGNQVRIRWAMGSGPARNDIGWNIDEVTVLVDGSVDTSPPMAVLTVANLVDGDTPVHEFSVEYFDDTAVRVSDIGGDDILVTGPNGFSNIVDLVGVNLPDDGPQRTATYSLSAPAGTWSESDNGLYTVTLLPVQVGDTSGNFAEEAVLGQFSVAISGNQQSLVVNPTLLALNEGETATVWLKLAEPPESARWVDALFVSGNPNLVIESGVSNLFDSTNWSNEVQVVFRALPDTDQTDGSATYEFRSEGLPSVAVLVNEVDNTPDAILRVSSNNPDWGSVEPTGGSYPVGSHVEVRATAAEYYEFVGWSGFADGSDNPLSVIMDADIDLEAEFRELRAATYGTPHWWLASVGQSGDFDAAELVTGANGVQLWQSYVAGLDPNNPDSQLTLRILPVGIDSELVFEWDPISNRLYSLFYSTSAAGVFVPLPGAVEFTDDVNRHTNDVSESASPLFYRLEVTLP